MAVREPSITNAVDAWSGKKGGCARRDSGEVACWGALQALKGRLVHASFSERAYCTVDDAGVLSCSGRDRVHLRGTRKIANGGTVSCALLSSGEVACWGSTDYGQLGEGSGRVRSMPVRVIGLSSATALWTNAGSCARDASGTVKCWGSDADTLLGFAGPPYYAATPVVFDALRGSAQVAIGDGLGCALRRGPPATSRVEPPRERGEIHQQERVDRRCLRRVESDLELTVEDNGEGIAPSFLPHVFESFRQADTTITRSHGGLGIGLSIAKHLVELHGGSIAVHSEGAGRGARFVVRLPVTSLVSRTLGVSRVPTTKVPSPSVPLAVGAGIRVVVVDDEPDARELVVYVLEVCGMEVRAVANPREAFLLLETFAPHVIVSDIGMPDEDGYTLIRRLRTHEVKGNRNIPVIALTAFAGSEERAHALAEGFNLHMTKPVEPSVLVNAVVELARPTPPM